LGGSDDTMITLSPQSTYSSSTGYGTEVAPLRWFGLLAGDAQGNLDGLSLDSLSDAALARRQEMYPTQDGHRSSSAGQQVGFAEGMALQNPSKMLQISAISPAPIDGSTDERLFWQCMEPIQLKDHEVGFAMNVCYRLDTYNIAVRYISAIRDWGEFVD
jgi:hypothetical protein